ncbi:MAG: BLUF domain-containing protein [Arenicella sp.]|nr:BLUF domain-containing protein [Arenicella sp.]
MHLFVYISDYSGRVSEIDKVLADIEAGATERNRQMGITGVLFYQNGAFLEVLEGPKKLLKIVVKQISVDKRHHNLMSLLNRPIEQRSFDDWRVEPLNFASHVQLDRNKLLEVSQALSENPSFRTALLVQFYRNMM